MLLLWLVGLSEGATGTTVLSSRELVAVHAFGVLQRSTCDMPGTCFRVSKLGQ